MINLTIIIPYFNTALLLKKLLDSIPMQEGIEVIVIDDNSTQNQDIYYSITQDKKYQNVVFLKNTTPYKGPGASRNIGIEKAQGKWILFADADDFFVENFYNTVSSYFSNKYDVYDVIYFIPTSIYLDTEEKGIRHIGYKKYLNNFLNNPSLINELNLKYWTMGPWSKLIKKDLLINNNIFFDTARAYEDNIFSTKVGFFSLKSGIKTFFLFAKNKIHPIEPKLYNPFYLAYRILNKKPLKPKLYNPFYLTYRILHKFYKKKV